MRVACIHSSVVPSRAANSIQIMKMSDAIAQEGHEVLLIVPAMKPGRELHVTDVHSFYGVSARPRLARAPWFPVKGRGGIFAVLAVLRAALFRPDVVYTRYARAGHVAALLGFDVIYECHAPEGGWSYSRLLRNRRLVRIVSISHALRDYLVTTHGLAKDRILVAHDGAELVPSRSPHSGSPADAAFAVAYAGHLYAGKGMELIRALVKRCRWAHFHVIGGRPQDIEYWRERTAGAENLRFHGFVPNSDVHALLGKMDALIAPYQPRVISPMGQDIGQWMSPLKIFEYMASGVPIVASDLPVLREILRHRVNALLCSPSDVGAWAAALEELRNDSTLAAGLARCAREELEARYTWRQRARLILADLAQTVGTRQSVAM